MNLIDVWQVGNIAIVESNLCASQTMKSCIRCVYAVLSSMWAIQESELQNKNHIKQVYIIYVGRLIHQQCTNKIWTSDHMTHGQINYKSCSASRLWVM